MTTLKNEVAGSFRTSRLNVTEVIPAGIQITHDVLTDLIERLRRFREALDREMESAGRPTA